MASRHFPEAIIRFVAKTGFITKALWGEFFFAGGQSRWKHKAWASFSRRGYLVPHAFQRISNVYVLNRQNREIADFIGGKAAGPPAAAQLDHDEILNRGLLRLERDGRMAHWTSEAELKSYGGRGVHRIETQGQLIKFPDALVQGCGRTDAAPMAIELEKTLKSRNRYSQIMAAYAAMRDLRAILYVCESSAIERAVQEALAAAYFPQDKVPVGFARIDEWKADPLKMEIRVSGEGTSWSKF